MSHQRPPYTEVPLSAEIAEHIENGSHVRMINAPRSQIVKRVDFANARVASTYDTSRHELGLNTGVCPTQHVVFLFPNYSDQADLAKQVLSSSDYRTLESFNREAQKRFSSSLHHTQAGNYVRLAVCYGDHVYICDGIDGTIYLVWAEIVNTTTHGNVQCAVRHWIPYIINMTGDMRVRGIFELKPKVTSKADLARMPVTRSSPKFFRDWTKSIFINESRKLADEDPKLSAISTISVRAARDHLTRRLNPSTRAAAYHRHESSIDAEAAAVEGMELEYTDDGYHSEGVDISYLTGVRGVSASETGPDDGAQGDPLGLGEAAAQLEQDPTTTPPIMVSEDERAHLDTGADPFAED